MQIKWQSQNESRERISAIQEYAERVWHVKPVKVELDKYIHGDAGLKVETPEAVLS